VDYPRDSSTNNVLRGIKMPGKLCVGEPINNAGAGHLSASKAYCEGMAYRASGTLIQRPFASNPHVQNSPDWNAWDYGWTKANDNAGGQISKADRGCCAASGVVPV